MSNLSELPLLPSETARKAPVEPQPQPVVRQTASLVPDSAMQFLDTFIPDEATAVVRRRYFEDEPQGGSDEAGALYVVSLDDGVFHHPVTREVADAGLTYTVEAAAALTAFADTWLPIPLLRVLSPDTGLGAILDQGPTNWARIFISRSDDTSGTDGWRVVLALDTTLSTAPPPKGHTGPSPTPDDVAAGTPFQFSADENDVGAFVTEAWIDDWLAETYAEHFRRRQRPGDDEWAQGHPLEHIANYLTLLSVLAEACALPEVRFISTGVDASPPLAVDLVLDIGAARTCALVRETGGDADPARPPIEPLPLRDLSRPWLVHDGILPSRVEFARAAFGREALSRWSGRANAFYWPSLARVGAEAERLAANQPSGADLSGLQSPIRYLWDDRRSDDVWRFARGPTAATTTRGAIVSGPQLGQLTETGDLLAAGTHGIATTKPRFSKSSLTTFAAAEIILQAMSAINAPERRARHARPEHPRRIGRIVLTVPGNMHPDTRTELRQRIENAIDLVWQGLGGEASHGRPRRPDVTFAADNATNAQSVYLLNEIVHKFHGKAREYFDLMGKMRPGQRTGRSLRIACFDIGGGTTSISVATYELADNGRIVRALDLVDGLPAGGDDILKAVIERHLMPALATRLSECGLVRPERLLQRLFQPTDARRDSADGRLAGRLAAHLLRPAAIALLDEHAASRTLPDDVPVQRSLGALLAQSGSNPRAAADTLDQLAADDGAEAFAPLATPVTFLHRELALTIGDVLAPVLQSAIRLVHALDCDVVLLSGWPSRLPIVLDTLLQGLPTRPNRIVPMNDYRVADWYPDRTDAAKIRDSKTTAAVGALIETIGALRLGTRAEPSEAQRLYIGRMGADGLIRHADVLFAIDPPGLRDGAEETPRTANLLATLPVLIGSRRVGLESWPATLLYQLELKDTGRREPPRWPLKITLERIATPQGGPDRLAIVKASDATGATILASELDLRPQSLDDTAGHWLDTGRIAVDAGIGSRGDQQ